MTGGLKQGKKDREGKLIFGRIFKKFSTLRTAEEVVDVDSSTHNNISPLTVFALNLAHRSFHMLFDR